MNSPFQITAISLRSEWAKIIFQWYVTVAGKYAWPNNTPCSIFDNACPNARTVPSYNISQTFERSQMHHRKLHDHHRRTTTSVYPCLHEDELQPHQLQPREALLSAKPWRLSGCEFTITAVTLGKCLSVTVSTCIQWVPIADVMGSKEVQCDPNSSTYQMGRLVLQQQILVGKFFRDYVERWKDGARYYDADVTEIMQLDPGCSANWVPYTPGDPFPAGTGHLGDPCAGTPIIRGLTSDGVTYRCGYYNAETQLGYLVFSNPETTTAMYNLVIT